MANGLNNNIKAGLLSGGGFTAGPKKNTPTQYADRQYQYFEKSTGQFTEQYAKYSSDYVEAELQYWDENGAEAWENVTVRFANIVTPTAAITRHFDDYKNVLFDQRHLDYVRPGVKLRAMGSTWLAINPDNISSDKTNSIFRRCNAVWNHLDYYGNIVSEPIIVENARANASAPDTQIDQQISTGYFNVTCQYNGFTRQINDNTRIILGDAGSPYENAKAYRVTGFANFFREFTDDNTSVRVLTFTIRVQTKNSETDDLINCVADGKDFSWNAEIVGFGVLRVGESEQFSVSSVRNGKSVSDGAEYPIRYIWTTSNKSTVTVDQSGLVTAVSTGNAIIRATLAENPTVYDEIKVYVSSSGGTGFVFTSYVPTTMGPLDSATISAAYYVNGNEADGTFVWTGYDADANSYSLEQDGNNAILTCFGYSEKPLRLVCNYTADPNGPYAGVTATVGKEIKLEDV